MTNHSNESKPIKVAAKTTSKVVKHKAKSGGRGSGGGAVKTILHKVAAWKMVLGKPSVEREKLSTLTGIQAGSTLANALTKLKKEGLMNVTRSTVSITDKGMETVDPNVVAEAAANIPTTNEAFHDSIKVQYKLSGKAIQLFDCLSDGKWHRRKDIAEAIGMQTNSTYANMVSHLKKKLGIIAVEKECMRLTDDMFPFTPRLV
jgi:Mn-dependent DtxR family transcriptional regulator